MASAAISSEIGPTVGCSAWTETALAVLLLSLSAVRFLQPLVIEQVSRAAAATMVDQQYVVCNRQTLT